MTRETHPVPEWSRGSIPPHRPGPHATLTRPTARRLRRPVQGALPDAGSAGTFAVAWPALSWAARN